ncbi:MAG: ATP-binding cassette domain-containing protein [Planctomycetes bacterium]|nr:ATP-binding cassette domain-containing protein [Planctomycetota bacterium]
MIEVEHLRKTFRVPRKQPGFLGSLRSLFRRETVEVRAVEDVSFRVGEGEIVGLLGANGAGKTTIVKMLAGIVHPTGGSARVLGFDPWQRDDRFRAQIALVMGQKAQLWWDLPAADSFLLLKEIYQVPDDRYRETLGELTSVLGVSDEVRTPVRKLSLGERMKMELIAALLHRPRVVFLDEPTIGLDVNAQRAVREFLLAYRERHRPAVLLTSHSMEDIERLCKRVLIVKEGRLVFDGALDDVVARYAHDKLLTVKLDAAAGVVVDAAALASVGEVVEATAATVRVRVPRARTAAAAGELLARLPVADLAIEEDDVASIVGRIFAERGEAAP